MIARLTGVVEEKREGAAVLDVGGVGYLVHLSAASLAALPPRGERVALRIHTHVREDALDLFGFATEEEQEVFRALVDVKGVGPRAAQNILSGIEPASSRRRWPTGDVARLTKVPGVGKKTAERLVVELKDKLVALARAAGPAKGHGRRRAARAARAGARRASATSPRRPRRRSRRCATRSRGRRSTSCCARR